MLDQPSIGMMIKLATLSYMTQFNWSLQAAEMPLSDVEFNLLKQSIASEHGLIVPVIVL